MAIPLSTPLQSAFPRLVSVAYLASTNAQVLFKWPWCWLISGQLAENVQQSGYQCQELNWQQFVGFTAKNDPWYGLLGCSCDWKKFCKAVSHPPPPYPPPPRRDICDIDSTSLKTI